MRNISSSVNIIWTTGIDVVRRAENLSVAYTVNDFAIYTDLYEISSLTPLDNGRNYECTVLINASRQINSSDEIVLKFTGELIYVRIITICIYIIHTCISHRDTSIYVHTYIT